MDFGEMKLKAWHPEYKVMVHFDLYQGEEIEVEELNRVLKLKNCEIIRPTFKRDKNNQEIFEGDIVTSQNINEMFKDILKEVEKDTFLGIVEWDEDNVGFCIFEPEFYDLEGHKHFNWEELEIVGNKFENPELMGED